MQWFRKASKHQDGLMMPSPGPGTDNGVGMGDGRNRPKLVVAHFMLGNTYPFTDKDWETTFDLAEATSLDGLALNLGPEDWQLHQAQRAYSLISQPISSERKRKRNLRLFLSLDLNVLPPDPAVLVEKVLRIVDSAKESQLRWGGGVVLSTFGGQQMDNGWRDVIAGVEKGLGEKVFFWPSLFLPPHEILAKDYVHGAFHWNGAWPMGNHTTNLDEDRPFLQHEKPYMAAVSPLFFTHYGTEGQWAWNKNWIYRSDDLLLPTRFQQLLSLPVNQAPAIIQVISWNDYGESHYIAPVLGAQPGSESWTAGMDHEGFRWLVSFFSRKWRDGVTDSEALEHTVKALEGSPLWGQHTQEGSTREAEGEGKDSRVVLWYRTQSKDLLKSDDAVAKPDHAEWAQDLLNFFILIPDSSSKSPPTYTLNVQNGGRRTSIPIQKAGSVILKTVPFVPGPVSFEITDDLEGKQIISGQGRPISGGAASGEGEGRSTGWNYNMWSGIFGGH
ncbi:hypothetical protein IAU59_003841 [Kwoniella sp. CBS 9459]